jgi:hypothetical protein
VIYIDYLEYDVYDIDDPKSAGYADRLLDWGDDSRDQAAGR